MQTQQNGRRDPTAIFTDMGQASAQPSAAQVSTPRAHTEVVSPDGNLVTDDPNVEVEAVVRPNHNYGGMPAGTAIRLPFKEFDGHRAALCSKAEYARITALQASPGHQSLQRQLAAMRAATDDAFYRGLSPEKRAELEAARKQAAADDQREETHRREIAQAAAAARPAPVQATAPAVPETVEALEALIAQRRAKTEQLAAAALPRAAERLRAVMDEEEVELRQAFLSAQEQAATAAKRAQELAQMGATPAPVAGQNGVYDPRDLPPPPIEERLARLGKLFADSLITAEAYQQRQAEILKEV